jgi:hypothetical protein
VSRVPATPTARKSDSQASRPIFTFLPRSSFPKNLQFFRNLFEPTIHREWKQKQSSRCSNVCSQPYRRKKVNHEKNEITKEWFHFPLEMALGHCNYRSGVTFSLSDDTG